MAVLVRAIAKSDLDHVGQFLNRCLNERVSAETWVSALQVPWAVDAPNYGFLLENDGSVVGAYLAFYSDRRIDGRTEQFCNLGAWCVEEKYRFHSVKLLKALLAQPGYTFTDLSPSGSVVPLNERLKFVHLDTTTFLIPGLPYPSRPGRVRINEDPAVLESELSGRDLEIYRDHRDTAAARHLLIRVDGAGCYVIFRKDRRKDLPVFASVLHVSDRDVFRTAAPVLARHLLVRHGILATLAEQRVVGPQPRPSLRLPEPRRKMYRSSALTPDHIDYLYSELVCVAW